MTYSSKYFMYIYSTHIVKSNLAMEIPTIYFIFQNHFWWGGGGAGDKAVTFSLKKISLCLRSTFSDKMAASTNQNLPRKI